MPLVGATISKTRGSRVRKGRNGIGSPTVADVARAAGVSPMTVSRVVNNEPNVTETTRKKVIEAVAALGYVPNAAARVLAGVRQCRIALLHSNPSAAYLSEFLMGSLAETSDADIQLLVEHVGTLEPDELLHRLRQHRIDGVLLPPPLCDNASIITALNGAAMRIARIATADLSHEAIAVTIDDEAAAFAMTSHLIGLGHRSIGFIAGNSDQSVSALRYKGFYRALGKAGIAPDPQLIVPGDFTYRSGLEAAERLLTLDLRPSAIFAANDDMAAATVATANRHGLEVPRDLSVCGFDDTAIATTIWPGLTTIRQPVAEMARIATRLLADELRREQSGRNHEQLAFELVHRGSVAPPSGGQDRST